MSKILSNKNYKTDLISINKNIDLLNNNFKNLSIQIEELKKMIKISKSDKNNSNISR